MGVTGQQCHPGYDSDAEKVSLSSQSDDAETHLLVLIIAIRQRV